MLGPLAAGEGGRIRTWGRAVSAAQEPQPSFPYWLLPLKPRVLGREAGPARPSPWPPEPCGHLGPTVAASQLSGDRRCPSTCSSSALASGTPAKGWGQSGKAPHAHGLPEDTPCTADGLGVNLWRDAERSAGPSGLAGKGSCSPLVTSALGGAVFAAVTPTGHTGGPGSGTILSRRVQVHVFSGSVGAAWWEGSADPSLAVTQLPLLAGRGSTAPSCP